MLVSMEGWEYAWRAENYITCTQRDLNVFMLRIILSVNFSAKHESHYPSGFFKVILLSCLNQFSMNTLCLLFLKKKVKAQGGGPDSRCCGSPCQKQIHSLRLACLSTMACDWKREWLDSRKSFCSVFALSV